jgi:hypothetical protein
VGEGRWRAFALLNEQRKVFLLGDNCDMRVVCV